MMAVGAADDSSAMLLRNIIPKPLGRVNPLVRAGALLFMVGVFVFVASMNRPARSNADSAPDPKTAAGMSPAGTQVSPNNSSESGNVSLGSPTMEYQVSVNIGAEGRTYNVYTARGKALMMGGSLEELRARFPQIDVSTLTSASRGGN